MGDQEIIGRIRKGDESAVEYLYKQNYKTIRRLVLKNSGTDDEAQDIFQEGIIILYERIIDSDFDLTSKLSTFLYSICLNLWRKELKKKSRNEDSEKDVGESPDYERSERVNALVECMNMLGDTCKQILTLYYFEKMSMKEIAETMKFANSDTAKTKKYKCKADLEKLVKRIYNHNDFWD